jgi:hypothetical protein
MKKILIIICLLFVTGCTTENIVYQNPDKEKEIIEVVYEDFKLVDKKPRNGYTMYKLTGPGTVEQAIEVFKEHYIDEGWEYDKLDESYFESKLSFRDGDSNLIILIASDYPTGIIVIIEEPYQ